MTSFKKTIPVALTALILLLCSTPAHAGDKSGDKSYSSVIKHIKSTYGTKQQSFYGAMMFARFLVKVVRPAGVKNFKVAWLKEMNLSEHPDRTEFHESTRRLISDEWQPLVKYNSTRDNQYTHVYVQHDKSHVKILVVTLQKNEAVVVQTKFSPEKLIKFIDDPKIMGLSLKDKNGSNDNQPPDGSKPPENSDDLDNSERSDKKPIKQPS
jgi:hypothetical protein